MRKDELTYMFTRPEASHKGHKSAWIPVSELLPKVYEDVLAYDGLEMFIDYYDERFDCWHSEIQSLANPVLYWMHLPKPPKSV